MGIKWHKVSLNSKSFWLAIAIFEIFLLCLSADLPSRWDWPNLLQFSNIFCWYFLSMTYSSHLFYLFCLRFAVSLSCWPNIWMRLRLNFAIFPTFSHWHVMFFFSLTYSYFSRWHFFSVRLFCLSFAVSLWPNIRMRLRQSFAIFWTYSAFLRCANGP